MMNRLLTILLLAVPANACAELGRGDPSVEVDASIDAARETVDSATELTGDVAEDAISEADSAGPPISFADGVHDILIANCTASGCHGAGAGGFLLSGDIDADYTAVLDRVVPGDALASKLIKKSTATSSHTGGPVLQAGTPDYDLVVAWINDGANP